MHQQNCTICELRCRLEPGRTGACGMYTLQDDHIVERYPDRFLVACPISIETMPILHFYPGTKFLQITTTGCNFNCPGCISTALVREMRPDSPALKNLTVEQVVAKALEMECQGIVFLMNDPLAAFPRFVRIAQLAQEKHLKVGCSSNTYFTEESLAQLLPYLDFINIGMKGFTDAAYRACGVPGIQPVLRNLATLHKAGVHVEISCILTKQNSEEIAALARHIASLSKNIPLQVMRFLPFETAPIAMEPPIHEAEQFCAELGRILDFVYLFNTPGSPYLHTRCPQCGQVVLRHDFFGPMGAKLHIPKDGLQSPDRCPHCSRALPIIGLPAKTVFQEADFQGGYPLTRALEIVEAMLIAMGITSKSKVAQAWEAILQDGGLTRLHHDIQQPRAYIQALRAFGAKAGSTAQAEELAGYLGERLALVEKTVASQNKRPQVYYAMGKPIFYLNCERMENQLVECAGGISVNKTLLPGGRPGRTLSVEQLNALNPDVIFISAFLSNSVDDFLAECVASGVNVKAVRDKRIYAHPASGWDFGSPRWILGLLYIAQCLYPQYFSYDVMEEAKAFYKRFYHVDFAPSSVNRSFAKPVDNWRWQEV